MRCPGPEGRLLDQLPGPLLDFYENDGTLIDSVGRVGFEIVDPLRAHDFLGFAQCGAKGIAEGLGTWLRSAQRQRSRLGEDLRGIVGIRGKAVCTALTVGGFVPFGELGRHRLDWVRVRKLVVSADRSGGSHHVLDGGAAEGSLY